MLEDVISYGTGKKATIGRKAAGKTGTSQDYRDAWFIGYSQGLTVGVWVGRDDNLPMENLKAVDQYFLGLISQSANTRGSQWNRDYSSPAAYHNSIQKHRDSLRRRISAVDPRLSPHDLQLVGTRIPSR